MGKEDILLEYWRELGPVQQDQVITYASTLTQQQANR